MTEKQAKDLLKRMKEVEKQHTPPPQGGCFATFLIFIILFTIQFFIK